MYSIYDVSNEDKILIKHEKRKKRVKRKKTTIRGEWKLMKKKSKETLKDILVEWHHNEHQE